MKFDDEYNNLKVLKILSQCENLEFINFNLSGCWKLNNIDKFFEIFSEFGNLVELKIKISSVGTKNYI